jgi:glycosyltransferase involved in cell wall biosynthesis
MSATLSSSPPQIKVPDPAPSGPIGAAPRSRVHQSAVAVPPAHWGLRRMDDAARVVGVVAPHYNLERLSYLLPVHGYRFVTLRRLPLQRLETGGTFWANTPILLDRSVPLVHTWNMLPPNARRFVISFELELPRYLGRPRAWQMRMGLRLLSSRRCRAILALSDIAARLAREQLSEAGHVDAANKVRTFRGAVMPSRHDAEMSGAPATPPVATPPRDDASASVPLRLLFVGADGIRKGLIPTLDALDELRRGGVDARLTLVSSIRPSTFITGPDPVAAADAVRARVAAAAEWIDHRAAMPNADVRRALREHDLLLLPTFEDSLGWAIVEAGMESLPTIGTNIFAVPELIDDGATGRLIGVPLDRESRWRGLRLEGDARRAAVGETNELVRRELVRVLSEVAADRALLRHWGAAAREKMHRQYHPDLAAAELKQIYDAAIFGGG